MGDSHRQEVIRFLITTRDRGMDRPRQVVIPFLITTRDKTNKRQKHRVITPRGPKHICLFLAQNFLSWWGKCAWKIQKTGVVHFYIRVDRIFKGRGSSVHCTQCSFKNVNASVTLICFTIVSTQKLIFTNPVFPASLTRICPTMFKRVKRRRICFSSSGSYYSYGQKLRLLSAWIFLLFFPLNPCEEIVLYVHAVLRSRWSRNYLGPGAWAEIEFLINMFCSQFGGFYDEDELIYTSISIVLLF